MLAFKYKSEYIYVIKQVEITAKSLMEFLEMITCKQTGKTAISHYKTLQVLLIF